MNKPTQPHLKFILLEDNQADAVLIKQRLKEAFQNQFEVVHFEKLKDILAYLGEAPEGDLIFSDLNLPDSEGISTVTAIQAVNPNIPLIVLTSSLEQGEDILALKDGAQDFLVKNDLSRHMLKRIVKFAIHRNKLNTKLMQSESRLRTVLNNSIIGQIVLDENKICNFCNPAARRLLDTVREGEVFPFQLDLNTPKNLEISQDKNNILYLELTAIDFYWNNQPAFLVTVQDITRIKKKEAWETERETLKNIKHLAGAIAHEFSQPLQILDHSLEFMEKEIEHNNRVDTCRRMTNRIIDLVRYLRNIVVLEKQDYLHNQIINLRASGGNKLSLDPKLFAQSTRETTLKTQKIAEDNRKRILLVDDEPELMELLGKALNSAGFDCHLASNGQIAWEMMRISRPHLIISDIYMPQMSGPELFTQIREHKIEVPFLFITGYHTPEDTPEDIARADDVFF